MNSNRIEAIKSKLVAKEICSHIPGHIAQLDGEIEELLACCSDEEKEALKVFFGGEKRT